MCICMAWQNTLKCIHFICGHLETYLSERLVACPAEFELSRCLLPFASFLADFLSRFLGAAWARPSAWPGRLLHKHCPDPRILHRPPCLPFLCFIWDDVQEIWATQARSKKKTRKRRKIHLRNYFGLTFAAPKGCAPSEPFSLLNYWKIAYSLIGNLFSFASRTCH